MNHESILPGHFTGDWVVVSDTQKVNPKPPARGWTIGVPENRGGRFFLKVTETAEGPEGTLAKDSFEMMYHSEDDNLVSAKKKLCLAFWRNPSADHLSATELNRNGEVARVWGARRSNFEDSTPPCIAGIVWKINVRQGNNAARGFVQLAASKVDAPKILRDAAPQLYYLYQMDDKKGTNPNMYDIVRYSSRTKSFDSIFNVRSLNYWKDGDNHQHLFASFDSRFTLPAGHFGAQSHVGRLMHFEEEILNIDTTTKVTTDDADDLDVGSWGGDPG